MNDSELSVQELATSANPPRLGRKFIQDPHALYRRLRTEAPVHRVRIWGGRQAWLVTRYAEARALLADPLLSKDWQHLVKFFPSGNHGAHNSVLNRHMLQQDPPDHTRLRKLVAREFTQSNVHKMRPDICRIADQLLDGMARDGATREVDLMQSYATQLPLQVMSALLGVPPSDRENFKTHVEPLLTSIDSDELQAMEKALIDLLAKLIAQKRRQPAEDLLSALVHSSDFEDQLSPDELLATAFLLILAGYETTVNLIGNGVLALLRNPSQLAALRADLSLMPTAVEEFLRFESPLNTATTRFTIDTVRIGEVEIPAGQLVVISLLGANRDARRYGDPDRLDIARTPNPHLAFGHGIHHCLGAALARLEGEIAIGRLLARFERIRLGSNAVLEYRSSTLMRGLTTLPVRIS